MESFDWKLAIRRNILMLKAGGLWPYGDEAYKLNFYTFYAFFILVTVVCGHNITQLINIFLILDDLELVVANIFISITESLSILKCYYLIRNMKILKELMRILASDERFQPQNDRQMEMLKPGLSFWRMLYNSFAISVTTAIIFCIIFPILDKSDNQLPFSAWYPWNYKVSPGYQVAYVYQSFGLTFSSMWNVNIDTLIAALNMSVGAQCDILCDNLRHIHTYPDVNKQLINCIKHHKAILRFSKNSNSFFNWIVLLQFFVSALSIGLAMFHITVIVTFSTEFYYCIFYLMAMVVQIFMYCWFGNEAELKSSNIPYAIFESDWTKASMEVKKNLIIFTLRTQKPIKISALNLFYLTLDTFVRILRTAYSYFALVYRMKD